MSQLAPHPLQARRLLLTGKVQGVGFRPFVFRLATDLQLRGWVQNLKGQVLIHAEGTDSTLDEFESRLTKNAPEISEPSLKSSDTVDFEDFKDFSILESENADRSEIHIPPDYHMCPACQAELSNPSDRRYRYPFINCTQCGPRFTLIESLPYDRQNTSMRAFPLCPACQSEYEDPLNRRFHAEPVACPECGPSLEYKDPEQHARDSREAMKLAVSALNNGQIIAVKGVGGYHLMCDATDEEAVQRLRHRKNRPDKPLAVLCPATGSDGLDTLKEIATADDEALSLLTHPSHPIVLAEKNPESGLAPGLAPGLREFGVFLPYSPLHFLLLKDFDGCLVATSANLSGEPVLTDNDEVEKRLSQIADGFLHHNRRIVRPADDSVYRFIAGKPRPLRIGRGVAPLELELPIELDKPVLAVGGQMKNAIALAWENRIVISPHIGDLESPRSIEIFENTISDLCSLYEVNPEYLIVDKHPGYSSHKWARRQDKPVIEVLHHHAHAAMLPFEYPESNLPWLVFTWDGVGLGENGKLWGGEAFFGQAGSWARVASFRPFRLSGGDRAGREPWRSAASLCWETGTAYSLTDEQQLARQAWERGINSPESTAVGRLFDAASSLVGLIDIASYEGQGPMHLEALCRESARAAPLPLTQVDGIWQADWEKLIPSLLNDATSMAKRAEHFHARMASTLIAQAEKIQAQHGELSVGLSGGVFQNSWLCELIMALGKEHGIKVYMPGTIPCNDGGLCAGQVTEAAAAFNRQHQIKE